uniref:Uncharacterized protein n=1 Tax=Cyanothece sp. (strain PCC 7425 / ATCC 29141) TaxID=395961 RepID=B8HUD0_CYAP4
MKITPNYPPNLRAISIGGAYGYLICTGQKECEARVWPTKFRGSVLIHVPTSTAWDFSFTEEDVDPQRCPKTAIIGYAEVVDCQPEIYEGEQIYLHYMENGLLLPSPVKCQAHSKMTTTYWSGG